MLERKGERERGREGERERERDKESIILLIVIVFLLTGFILRRRKLKRRTRGMIVVIYTLSHAWV